jgi:hypothetical protein
MVKEPPALAAAVFCVPTVAEAEVPAAPDVPAAPEVPDDPPEHAATAAADNRTAAVAAQARAALR